MNIEKLVLTLIAIFFLGLLCQCSSDTDSKLPDHVDFNYHIRPILAQNCYTCHGPDESSRKAGLRLDQFDGATQRLSSGHRAIVPGKANRSSLMARIISEDPNTIMPPPESKKLLSAHQIQLLERWINQGAEWKKHWAFIHPGETKKPLSTIDEYIEKPINDLGLHVSQQADANTLIRRVSYLLTGLPPTEKDLNILLGKPYEKVVDHYLESDHYGEHWARHWMDLVRYAEGMGHEFDFNIGGAHHYRDYLIRAFNEDVPYDQLVKEHLAGDMLDQPRISPDGLINESVIGTAYAFLGEGKHSPVDIKQEEADRIDNLIDVTSKTFQGLTISCARCHDHKFDPIPTTDYYAMYGMFESTRIGPVSFKRMPDQQALQKEALLINDRLRDSVVGYLANIDLKSSPPISNQIGDFQQSNFDGWTSTGEAFGTQPLFHKYASSRFYTTGIQGVLRSPTFSIQDSFIYAYAFGQGSTIRVIVDNFQLIQNPLYGSLSVEVNDTIWSYYKLDVSSVTGHKAYVEIMPGSYDRHHFQMGKDDFIEVQSVFSSNTDFKELGPDKNDTFTSSDLVELNEGKSALTNLFYDTSYVMGLSEGDAVLSPVFIRGSIKELSEELVPHGFISAVETRNSEFSQVGSGRLAWAESVVSDENPLTSRVVVNRIWHHIFGQGIVKTVDNFGLQGSLPSHPELLDFLAVDFMDNGWSFKKLIKKILLTETFRRSTKVDLENTKIDAENNYLASFPIRRIEAESIRDGILAVAGNLNREMYGKSVPVHLTEFMTGRGRPSISGPLDGEGRRSIYISIKRNFLSPMMLTFDMPIPFSTFGKRNITNVPAQSLFLMNDPFVHDQAAKWAERLKSSELSDEAIIEKIYLEALSRNPSYEEKAAGLNMLEEFAEENEEMALANFCHVIINMKEFIHLI